MIQLAMAEVATTGGGNGYKERALQGASVTRSENSEKDKCAKISIGCPRTKQMLGGFQLLVVFNFWCD